MTKMIGEGVLMVSLCEMNVLYNNDIAQNYKF
jgi:hypothetical protein